LTKKDAKVFPKNPKTGLANGDLRRMSFMFLILAIMGVIGILFLPWFEGDWGNDWYLEYYGLENFFDTMMVWIQWATGIAAAIGIALSLAASRIEPKKL
jgi:hypothetical protein